MQITEVRELTIEQADAWVARVPFFKALREVAPEQLAILLPACCLVELEPGEVIMRRGQRGGWLYFLLKGGLHVFHDDPGDRAFAEITPGEMFGDLALFRQQERKATVASAIGRNAVLWAFDVSVFGELDDLTRITLATKLLFYRMVAHSIRWRLEVSRMAQPAHPLVAELLRVPVFSGQRDSMGELTFLYGQASTLAALLEHWNAAVGVCSLVEPAEAGVVPS